MIAEPVDDARVRDRGARVLAGAPGGPSEAEARRRLNEGLPLIVGLTRATTEQLQDDLIGAGVVARLGPAPAGTTPLEGGSDTSGVGVRVVLALAIPVLSVALWLLWAPADEKGSAEENVGAVATIAATPEPADLRVSAAIEPYGRTSYTIVGIARALIPLESTAALELQLRDAPDGKLIHVLHVVVSDNSVERGFVSFRESLHTVGFGGGEEVWVIGFWGDLRSNPRSLKVPPRSPR